MGVFAFSVYIHRQADGQDSIREAASARARAGLLTWLCSKQASSADSMPAAVSSPPCSQHPSAPPSPAAPRPANAGIYHSLPPCASSSSVSGDSLCVEREREERERERERERFAHRQAVQRTFLLACAPITHTPNHPSCSVLIPSTLPTDDSPHRSVSSANWLAWKKTKFGAREASAHRIE